MILNNRCSSRPGYVLVVTLGLLVLSSTLLVAVGRVAVRHALAAREAEDHLQRRWATISCRNAVLPFADQILANAEVQQVRPVPVTRIRLRLGAEDVELIVSDEQAKANVNALLEVTSSDKSEIESRIRQSLSGTGLMNAVRIRPASLPFTSTPQAPARLPGTTQPSGHGPGVPRWITGLGQIFDNVAPPRLLAGPGSAPIDVITCWGPGATNVLRASEKSLILAAGSSMSAMDIGRLIVARNAQFRGRAISGARATPAPGTAAVNAAATDPIGRLLAQAKITVKDRGKLPLSAGTACYSLWIIVGDSPQARHYLIVSDESNPQKPRIDSFVW
jgi:hypothetical protein